MKKTSFRHYNLDQASRKNLQISAFAGVDYSTQKFLVANNRAIDLLNYIYKDGIIQKRNGIEEIYHVKPYSYITKNFNGEDSDEVKTNGTNFNGIWQFIAEDKKIHIVAHVGKLLYEITNINNSNIEISPIIYGTQKVRGNDGLYYYQCYEFEDYKSSAFVGGNKLWFLGGNKYMCLRFLENELEKTTIQFFAVENSDFTPIPTTTISITYKNSIASGHRSSLDKTNLLTMWRKNKLISGTTKNEDEKTKTPYFDYTLDSPLICQNQKQDMANFSLTIEERGVIDNGV